MEKISYKEVPMEKYDNDTIKSLCAEVGITIETFKNWIDNVMVIDKLLGTMPVDLNNLLDNIYNTSIRLRLQLIKGINEGGYYTTICRIKTLQDYYIELAKHHSDISIIQNLLSHKCTIPYVDIKCRCGHSIDNFSKIDNYYVAICRICDTEIRDYITI